MTLEDGANQVSRGQSHVFEELKRLVDYIEETRQTLGSLHTELPAASDALSAVTQITEKATHNILELVERLVTEDEQVAVALEKVRVAAEASQDAALESAVAALTETTDRRAMMLTEMMSELSFQDLTCQAINRISGSILEIERRVMGLIELDSPGRKSSAGVGHSGLSRLREAQGGASRQGQIDDLLQSMSTPDGPPAQ